ncbi:MAG: hypothetical protein Q8832_02790, partial [Candidatus Phytoplasma australasiaticum]|nr:hypothetical protein [Candidatus Phytoplasma australasiaticum]
KNNYDLAKAISYYDYIEVQPPQAYRHIIYDLNGDSDFDIDAQPHAAQQTTTTTFRAFKSLKPTEFLGSADPVEAQAWLKEIEKSLEILGVEEKLTTGRSPNET